MPHIIWVTLLCAVCTAYVVCTYLFLRLSSPSHTEHMPATLKVSSMLMPAHKCLHIAARSLSSCGSINTAK